MNKVLLLFGLMLLSPVPAQAHTLGVDKGELTELKDGSYHLVSRVPPRFQPLITTPELPPGCALEGNPRGARGPYEVRFVFRCEEPLAADDDKG